MSAYNKFYRFPTDLLLGLHLLQGATPGHVIKVALSNTLPNVATGAILADITQIAATNGYSAGGSSVGNVSAASGGVETITATNVVFTASGGPMGPFRYVVAYNSTQGTPVKPLIAFGDLGGSVTLADGESFEVKFNNGVSSGSLFTLG